MSWVAVSRALKATIAPKQRRKRSAAERRALDVALRPPERQGGIRDIPALVAAIEALGRIDALDGGSFGFTLIPLADGGIGVAIDRDAHTSGLTARLARYGWLCPQPVREARILRERLSELAAELPSARLLRPAWVSIAVRGPFVDQPRSVAQRVLVIEGGGT